MYNSICCFLTPALTGSSNEGQGYPQMRQHPVSALSSPSESYYFFKNVVPGEYTSKQGRSQYPFNLIKFLAV